MLVYSDNYKHNNLIYSQVVVIDVTTNGSTTSEGPGEAQPAGNRATFGGACAGPSHLSSPQSSSYTTPTQLF